MPKARAKAKAFFIDLDGTLADTLPAFYRVYRTFLEELGLQGTKEEFISLIGPSVAEIVGILKATHGLNASCEALYERYRGLVQEIYAHHTRLFPGSREFLDLVHERRERGVRGVQAVLVTSAEKEFAQAFMEGHGIGDRFVQMITPEGLAHSKPHPAIYLRALERTGLSAGEVIAVEDSPNGVKAATAAGIFTIWIQHGEGEGLVSEEDGIDRSLFQVVKGWKEVGAYLAD